MVAGFESTRRKASAYVPSRVFRVRQRKLSEGLPCCAIHSRGQPDKHDLVLSRFVAKTISQEQLLGCVVLARRVGGWWEWLPEGGRTMRALAFVICAMAVSGCDEKNIAGPSVPVNQQVTLAVGQTATISDAGISIRCIGVPNDSRVP